MTDDIDRPPKGWKVETDQRRQRRLVPETKQPWSGKPPGVYLENSKWVEVSSGFEIRVPLADDSGYIVEGWVREQREGWRPECYLCGQWVGGFHRSDTDAEAELETHLDSHYSGEDGT